MVPRYIVFGLLQAAVVGAWFRNSPLKATNIVSRFRPFRDLVSSSLIALTISSGFTSPSIADIIADSSPVAQKSQQQQQQQVYFGVGCFWHVQHEFIDTERKVLGRQDADLTSLAGYAGGLNANKDNLVCYHNFQGIADYGSLGHGEVVGMTIPEDRYVDFATEYLSLFGKDLDRPDKGDMGPEYRSLIGLPGGSSNKLYDTFANVAKQRGFIVKEGQGNDPDTLFKKTIYVMDSNKFPFYPAEVYHQYHDGFFPGESYPQTYNDLQKIALETGKIKPSGCPEKFLPI